MFFKRMGITICITISNVVENIIFESETWLNFELCCHTILTSFPYTLVAKNTRCVPDVCRIAWDHFQLQQNCLYDI